MTLVSPGIEIKEYDLTQIINPGTASTGAICGSFIQGPAMIPVLVSSEEQLVKIFGKPDPKNYTTFFTAANFLQYSNRLYVVRAVSDTANTSFTVDSNSRSDANTISDTYGVRILNEDDWQSTYLNNTTTYSTVKWAAKYIGAKYDSLRVYACTDKKKYRTKLSANTIKGSNVATFNANVMPYVASAGQSKLIVNYSSNDGFPQKPVTYYISRIIDNGNANSVYLHMPALANTTNSTKTASYAPSSIEWIHAVNFDTSIGTSKYASEMESSDDEMHIIVVDQLGKITGKAGTILEKFPNVSKAYDAKKDDGTSNYYVEVIKQQSQYVYPINHMSTNGSWGMFASEVPSFGVTDNRVYLFFNGKDDVSYRESDLMNGYKLFEDKDKYTIDLLMAGDGEGSVNVINYVTEIAGDARKDCMAFVSPPLSMSTVSRTRNISEVLDDIVTFRQSLAYPTSYTVMDSGWKLQFDRYWNTYRYVPLNGDMAGLVARTERERDAWWSPAGFNRGKIRSVTKLSWVPGQAERDELYQNGINPVVTFPNEGTVLYGDKTLQDKTSAFDRINVRRLFLVLERAISTAAKYSLFEFNDEFTRAQFVSLVDPYLRDIKGRRGIYDYKIVCDETNNTPQVIDTNRFIGAIYIKPARSINYITLNFVAVGTGVDFNTVTDNSGI